MLKRKNTPGSTAGMKFAQQLETINAMAGQLVSPPVAVTSKWQ